MVQDKKNTNFPQTKIPNLQYLPFNFHIDFPFLKSLFNPCYIKSTEYCVISFYFIMKTFVLNVYLFSFDGKFTFPWIFWHKTKSTDYSMTSNNKKDSLFYNFFIEFSISIWKISCFLCENFRIWIFISFYSFFVRTLNSSLSRMNLRCCLQNIKYSTYKKDKKNQPPK